MVPDVSALWRSFLAYGWGVVRRFYLMLPPLLFDPFDLLNIFWGIEYRPSQWVAWPIFAAGLFLAGLLTYHDLKSRPTLADSSAALNEEAIWSQISEGARTRLVGWERAIVMGEIYPSTFDADVFNELQAAGLIEVHLPGGAQRVKFTRLGSQVVEWSRRQESEKRAGWPR